MCANAPRAVCVIQHVRETDGGSLTPCVGVHAKQASLNIQSDSSHSVSSCFCLMNRSLGGAGGANMCSACSFVGCRGTTSGHMTVCHIIIVSSFVKTHKSEGLYASRHRHDWDKCFLPEKITKDLSDTVSESSESFIFIQMQQLTNVSVCSCGEICGNGAFKETV